MNLLRALLLRRFLSGRHRRRPSRFGSYGRSGWTYGSGRSRRRSGFGTFGPFPSYSRRTRGGSRVTVTGCCLPIPLALTVGSVAGLMRLVRRR
jgi:hypothetical protein